MELDNPIPSFERIAPERSSKPKSRLRSNGRHGILLTTRVPNRLRTGQLLREVVFPLRDDVRSVDQLLESVNHGCSAEHLLEPRLVVKDLNTVADGNRRFAKTGFKQIQDGALAAFLAAEFFELVPRVIRVR